MGQIKLWLYAIASALLAVLGISSLYFKNKAERFARERDTLKATVHAERVRKKIEKEEKKALGESEEKIKKEIKNEKTANNLTNPNDW